MGNCCVIEKKEPEIEINKINFDDTPILIYEKEETPKSDKNIFNIDNNLETNEKEETSTSNNLKSKKEKIKEKNENNENKKEIPNKNLLINSSNLIEKLHIIDFQIFNIINEMRMNPKKFLKDSFKHKLNQIFENIISNQNKNLKNLNFPKNHLHEINIYLKDMKNIDKNLKAKENDIMKILGNKIEKKKLFSKHFIKRRSRRKCLEFIRKFR